MSRDQRDEKDIARRLRATGLAEGRCPREIAQAIYERCSPEFGTSLLKAYRLTHGVALEDVVEQVRALFEAAGREPKGLTTSLLSCYESGRKRPGVEYLHYLCVVYRVDPDDLGYEHACVCGKSHALVPKVATGLRIGQAPQPAPRDRGGTPIGGAERNSEGEEADDDMLRRTMLQILGGAGVALGGSLLGAVDRVRRRMDDTLVSATVSPTMLDDWEETVAGYGRQYMAVPPLWLLLEVVLDFSEVRRHCGRRQPIELQERLCRVAAQLAGLAGIIMIDLGDHRLSRSFFRTARSAADETGDRALRSWVVAREAAVPFYYGDPTKAIELARKSQHLAGMTPCAAAAFAPALEARAHARLARLGNVDASNEAEKALFRAESAFARLPSGEQGDTAFGYTERQLRFHQGNTLTSLGASRRALETQEEALELYPSAVFLDRTLIRFDQATCYLQANDIEEGLRLGRQILLETPPGHRTDIVLRRARELGEVVPSSYTRLSAVRDFHEVLALGRAKDRE